MRMLTLLAIAGHVSTRVLESTVLLDWQQP
jgi:hypothetical protein